MPKRPNLTRIAFTLSASCTALLFSLSPAAQVVTRGPYLQQGDTTSMMLKWRTDSATNTVVRFGTSPDGLTQTASNNQDTTEHSLRIEGLAPNTRYYYSIGNSNKTLAGGDDYYFETSPLRGPAHATRLWVIGDAGTANANQAAVYNAYRDFAGSTYTDLWLMLGDNAYNDGTDAQYQAAVFDMYPELLRQTPVWSTLGNHDGYSADSETQSGPYYDIFSFPTQAEVGGIASGTEAYYSFDYANIHFVVLDSYESNRSTTGAMMSWLKDDLQNMSADWLIALWHHPPYTKGSHNSDIEIALIQMRQNFLPVLESYGVDLVLNGHSHSYERSKFINGHYGNSGTFSSDLEIDGGSGHADGSGAYEKNGLEANSGTVYAVAGASGKISGGRLDHPAMFISLNELGSMVIDINGETLDAKYLNNNGQITDYFTIRKTTTPPALPQAPSNLEAGTVSSQIIALNWADQSDNEVGFDIERSLDGNTWSLTGSVGMNTTHYEDTGLTPNTRYYYRVRAKNSAGASGFSNVAEATSAIATPIVTQVLRNGLNNYSGTEDAYIASGSADNNWGQSENLNADGADGLNGELVALVKWDISSVPATATLTDAQMTLEIHNSSQGAYNVYAAGNTWAESSVTWGNIDIGQMQGVLVGTLFPSETGSQTLTLNNAGKAAVQSWIRGGANNGFLIRSSGTGDGIDMRSSEYSNVAERPAFSITYETGVIGEAPTAPSQLSAYTVSTNSIALQWQDNSSNETRFAIERSLDGVQWNLVATTATNSTSFTDSALQADTTYFYRVLAQNDAGSSPESNIASATTEPGAPVFTVILQNGADQYQGMQDTYVASASADANFGNDDAFNADGDDSGNGELVALMQWDLSSVPSNALISMVDINLEVFNTSPGEYHVFVMNSAWQENTATWGSTTPDLHQGDQIGTLLPSTSGNYTLGLNARGVEVVQQWVTQPSTNFGMMIRSAGTNDGVDIRSSEYATIGQRPSFTLTYTLNDNATLPEPPNSLQAYALSASSIDLSWDLQRSSNDVSVEVERSNDAQTWKLIATLHQDFDQFTDNGLERNTRYFYRVRAVNSIGASDYSNTAEATTAAQQVTVDLQEGVNGYNGAADTYIATWRPFANYGGEAEFEADGWDGFNGELIGLLSWNLAVLPQNARITHASITLNITNSSNRSYGLFQMLSAWQEHVVTPSLIEVDNSQGGFIGDFSPSSNGTYTIELNTLGISLLQDWLAEPSTNNGFMLRNIDTNDGIVISAKESTNANARPILSITYE